MNALITGGCGFVGRHLTNRLLQLGYNVTVVDNLVAGGGGIHPGKKNIDLHIMDCREFFLKPFLHRQYDEIYHLAAVVGGRLTIEDKPLAVAEDLSIDACFFNWVSTLKYDPAIFYFSSSAAYPVQLQTFQTLKILDERDIDVNGTAIGVPDLTYGWAKLTGEYLAKMCVEKYGKTVIIFRPFSGYGKDQHEAYPFPSILKRVMDNDNPVIVWGSGKQVRDFIYIEDCIDAIIHFRRLRKSVTVNLSTGIGTSFNELALLMATITHKEIHIKNTQNKPEGVFYRVGCTEKQHQYGFKAKKTLVEGIKKCL